MTPAEFEEKDYEGPLYNQLLCGNHRINTPGQVFENALGIDCSLEAHHAIFWDYFNFKNIPNGILLTDYRWGWVHRRHGKKLRISKFPVNLLIQAKRPDTLVGPNGKFITLGIPNGYWRFEINKHQQSLLNKLSRRLNHRALVVYASPAFDTWNDLDNYMESQQIVENSSFVNVERMNGHHTWNYNKAGCVGVGASEPEEIIDKSFQEQLISKLAESKDDLDPFEHLLLLDNAIQEVIASDPYNPICVSFYRRLNSIVLPKENEVMLRFLRVKIFFYLNNVEWFGAHRER
ncbi:hypothetical protein [Massilia sp. TWR1-2-2]|uniref:hypothetical protein n=1 Tax=Massilia sp. TWR1-2-2 TaxID=2804584 RepID=UPI003CF86A10